MQLRECMLPLVAVYFEKEEYDTCITECKEAVEIGRENKAEYKLISKYVYFI